MKITLNSSAERDQDHILSRQIAEILIGLGATVWIEQEAAHYYKDIPVVVAPQADCYAGARFAISVGGDGTFIKTAQLSAPEGAPVLGINKGTVGFLTELEEGELPLLGRLFRGDYQLERRMMLEFEVRRSGRGIARGLALNDVTVQRGTTPRLLELDIHQSGYRGKQHDLFITRWRGDGLIVSTPTGSTAYALSCGGPVIDPRSDCIELVPIGAHSLTSRPTIFGNDIELIVTPVSEGDRVAHVFHDGQPILEIQPGDNLMVRKAAISATVVHMKPESFYHTMRQKLRDY